MFAAPRHRRNLIILHARVPLTDFEATIVVFEDCCAGLDPVSRIHISDVPKLPYGRLVDVAAQHNIRPMFSGVIHDSVFERRNEADSAFDPVLAPLRE